MIITNASVAVKWYVSEIYTAEAEKLLDASYEIHAPELILPEGSAASSRKNSAGAI